MKVLRKLTNQKGKTRGKGKDERRKTLRKFARDCGCVMWNRSRERYRFHLKYPVNSTSKDVMILPTSTFHDVSKDVASILGQFHDI